MDSYADWLVSRPRHVVQLVTRCARALLEAHFSTGVKLGLIGANDRDVRRALKRVCASTADWRFFLYFCRKHLEGQPIELAKQNGLYCIRSRTKSGSANCLRPSIYMLVDYVFGDKCDRLLALDWYKDSLCDTYKVTDESTFLEFALEWIERFNRVKGDACTRDELLNLVRDRTRQPEDSARQWSAALIEILEYMNVLRFSAACPEGYALYSRADAGRVLPTLLGRSVGVEGLDELLYGGLWVPGGKIKSENTGIVVSGAAATGKSTLALAMGCHIAARGGLCLYFRFELDEALIDRKISQHYRALKPFFRLVSITPGKVGDRRGRSKKFRDGFEDNFKSLHRPDPVPDGCGLFALSDTPSGTLERTKEFIVAISDWLSRFPAISERIVVFDSISALDDFGADKAKWRTALFELTYALRTLGYVVVYVVERDRPVESDFLDFVSDIGIRLFYQEGNTNEYTHRYIEITKSRTQMSHRGAHMISIGTDTGLKVFPSSAAVISSQRRKEASRQYTGRELINPGIEHFARYLGGNGGDKRRKSHQVPWWRRGSVTAVIGDRGSTKSFLGDAFLAPSVESDEDSGWSLALHFGDEFSPTGIEFKSELQRPIPYGVRYDILFESSKDAGSGLTYLLFRSGFVTPGLVLNVVNSLIRERQKELLPVRRAVISDLGNLRPDFPSLQEDPVFVAALCDRLTSEGITTLLVYSSPQEGVVDSLFDQVRSISENIIRLQRVSHAGKLHTAIWVERSSTSLHDRGTYELQCLPVAKLVNTGDEAACIEKSCPQEAQGDNVAFMKGGEGSSCRRKLKVSPTFDLVVGLPANPQVAKVKLILHSETELQRLYNGTIARLHRDIGAFQVDVLPHAQAFAQARVAHRALAAERALWIVQVDAPMSTPRSTSGESIYSDILEKEDKRLFGLRRKIYDIQEGEESETGAGDGAYHTLLPQSVISRRA